MRCVSLYLASSAFVACLILFLFCFVCVDIPLYRYACANASGISASACHRVPRSGRKRLRQQRQRLLYFCALSAVAPVGACCAHLTAGGWRAGVLTLDLRFAFTYRALSFACASFLSGVLLFNILHLLLRANRAGAL
jgi:hypothetical protein